MSDTPEPVRRIVHLITENVKRLRLADIRPTGRMIRITGRNGAGKSSLLDSIEYALSGTRSHPPHVITQGESRATVIVDLGDLVVTRKWSEKGSTLEIVGKNGEKFKSPQAILDRLYTSLTFNPVAFMRVAPAEQSALLRKLIGLDFSAIDQRRAALVADRTEATRVKAMRERLIAVEPPDPGAVPAFASLVDELTTRKEIIDVNAALRARETNLRVQEDDLTQTLNGLELHMQTLRTQLTEAEARHQQALVNMEVLKQTMDQTQAENGALIDPDLEEIHAQLRTIETQQEAKRVRQTWEENARLFHESRRTVDALSDAISAVDLERTNLLAQAAFPVPGLSVDDTGPTLNGLPLEQASQAEQIRVSTAMGLAMHPSLRVMLIEDGSLLDDTSLALLEQLAEEHDAQIWIEMVGDGGDGAVVIEDGVVVGAETEGATA